MRALLLLSTLVLGCATGEAAKCLALRSGLRDASGACDACLAKMGVHGETEACAAFCEQPGRVAPLALNHCAAAAREIPAGKATSAK